MSDAAAAATPAPEVAPPDKPGKSARERILDHFADSAEAGPQSIAQIVEATGVDRNTIDQALHRAIGAEEVERVDRGTYKLLPAKPKPPPTPKLIPASAVRLPPGAGMRKFIESAPDGTPLPKPAAPPPKPAAPSLPAITDAELLEQLILAANRNLVPGDALMDLRPIRVMLETVDLDDVLSALRCKVDRRMLPHAAPVASWGEPRFLRMVAETYLRRTAVPRLIEAWSKTAPGKPAERPEAPAGSRPSW